MKPATSKVVTLPPPTGLNLVDSPGALGPGECLVLTNLIRSEMGTRTRSGYRTHIANLGGAVRSIFGFAGSSSANDRLFATRDDGIYGVSSVESFSPTVGTSSGGDGTLLEGLGVNVFMSADRKMKQFPTINTVSGYGVSHGFTTLAGEHYMLYTDEANGYYVYTESTDSWAKIASGTGAGQINGADPANFAFVTVWKKRIWFVKKDSTLAYYLPVDQYAGNVAAFDFGPQFRHGGSLVGIWSWTMDAGEGIDDMLVAVSSSGDVVVYGGTDPAYFPEIYLKGVWYIGSPPAGRMLGTAHGGDLLLLSSLGLVPMSKLVTGGLNLTDSSGLMTHKVSPAVTTQMMDYRTTRGWATAIHPEDSLLMVLVPDETQWAMSTQYGTWSRLTGLPMTCAAPWNGKLYFGTSDGRVCVNDGAVDDATDAPDAIESSFVPGFTSAGTALLKRLLMSRLRLIATDNVPTFQVEGRVEFDTTEAGEAGLVTQSTNNTWDTAEWDVSVWGGTSTLSTSAWRGIVGYGIYVSLAVRLASMGATTIPSYDLMLDSGGI